MVDGQFGSTGKGVLAAFITEHRAAGRINIVVSNAGPNSGHTFYTPGGEKIVLKQLPTFAVAIRKMGGDPLIYLSPGSIINPDILNKEVAEHGVKVHLADTATVITSQDMAAEGTGTIQQVAGTRQGVGAALARKVQRDPTAIVRNAGVIWHHNIEITQRMPLWNGMEHAFVEVSQGFSLGLHSQFYPKVTSRECTVMQAIADARIPAQRVRQVFMVIRTFPIRVGNHEGFSSGDCYYDQRETSWEELGVDAELTTVTQRVRRVFTFSYVQFAEALAANMPAYVFVNFMNYIKTRDERDKFAMSLRAVSRKVLGYEPKFLWGYGPRSSDVKAVVV